MCAAVAVVVAVGVVGGGVVAVGVTVAVGVGVCKMNVGGTVEAGGHIEVKDDYE